jgi:hypothetical protein
VGSYESEQVLLKLLEVVPRRFPLTPGYHLEATHFISADFTPDLKLFDSLGQHDCEADVTMIVLVCCNQVVHTIMNGQSSSGL